MQTEDRCEEQPQPHDSESVADSHHKCRPRRKPTILVVAFVEDVVDLTVESGRALLVLASKGLIKVKEEAGLKVTPADITENPKNIQIVELDAAQLPRSLDDTDASVINTNYATAAGLNPKKDAIAIESEKSPYANVIAVRAQDKDKPWVKTLVESYQSPEVKAFILEKYNGTVIPSW